MVSRGEPIPVIFAPILLRQFAKSAISGSQAADSITVLPFAKTAAIRTFAVPRTVEPKGPPRKISLPVRPLGVSDDVTIFKVDLCAELAQSPQVNVYWPVAYCTSTGH